MSVPKDTTEDTKLKEHWQRVFERRKQEIKKVSPVALKDDATFDTVQTSIQDLISRHEKEHFSRILIAITPTLERVNSFASALNTLSSHSLGSALTWGTLQIVIECVCRYSGAIEISLQLIVEMNNVLPLYERAVGLYSAAGSLRWPLQKIFDTYFDCCVLMLKEFGQTGLMRTLKAVLPSNLERTIKKKVNTIHEGEIEFYRSVDQLEREASTFRDIQQSRRIGEISSSLGLAPEQHIGRGRNEPKFPIRIEFRPNPSFMGRDTELEKIHAHLSKAPTENNFDTACCVIHGLGGQGKTQTALAYYWRYKEDYDVAFWLNSSVVAEVEGSYVKIARKLRQANILERISSTADEDTGKLTEIEQAREWFEGTNKRWLLIFDNLEDANLIETYLPVNLFGHGAAIITTQKAQISSLTSVFYEIELQPLKLKAGALLLCEIWGRNPEIEEESIIREICDWVGGLPLAIVTIAGYLKCSSSSVAEIFGSLKRSSNIWASTGKDSVRNYEKTLSTVFDLALSEIGNDSKHVIQIMAFLNPLGIPEELLTRNYSHIPSVPCLSDGDAYLAIRQDLGRRQLIKRVQSTEGTSLEIHRSLQLNLLHNMARELSYPKRFEVYNEVLGMLESILPAASRLQQNEKAIWHVFDKYVPQVLSLYRNSQWPDPPISLDFRFAKILSSTGTFLWHTGQIRECDAAMSASIAIIQMQPEEFKNTLECQSILSDIYLVTGIIADCIGVSRRKESLEQREMLCTMRENELAAIPPDQVSTDDRIRLGNAQGDLACAYLQRSRFEEAKQIMIELLKFYQELGTEDEYPYEYSKYYHHVAYALMAEGRPAEALAYAQKALDLDTAHAGGLDSTTLITWYDLASLYFNAGKVEESLEQHRKVLQNRIEVCGRNSQFTLESYEAVGILSHLVGLNDDATECFKVCLSNHHRAIWTTEGITRARYWHSKALKALGNEDAAKIELDLAMATRNEFLERYPEFLHEDFRNPEAVFDQMLPIWVLQLSGALQKGGRNPVPTVYS